MGGTDIAVAFVFISDLVWSDGDCLWPTAGAAIIDDVTVTIDDGVVTTWHENFEDLELGPDWRAVATDGVGDFARVWSGLGDLDPCVDNLTKQVAFIDDGLVVPGTGGTVGSPGNDYGPPGGYIVNNTGGLLGSTYHLQSEIHSPVMSLPPGGYDGLSFAFDVYRHELLGSDSPGVFYTWSVRSAVAGQDIDQAGWVDRNFVYYGGPRYVRTVNRVDDLIEPGATKVQVMLGAYEYGWAFGLCCGDNGTPAPYFDNVNVRVYRGGAPLLVATESRLANDGFPASGAVDLANLGSNSVRFDMAANISARTHQRNDPGDSITVDATPRRGGVLATPDMHWAFARRNALFDPYRTLPGGPVTGRVTRNATGAVVANRWNFDLPDTGMLFPGDVLHYYFSASDNVGGDIRVATLPGDLSGYGSTALGAWPEAFTVRCLPGIEGSNGAVTRDPGILFWNDAGIDDLDAWAELFDIVCWLDADVYTTNAASSGVGNGLGGRATSAQLAGYDYIIYTSGALGAYTLSSGDYTKDPGNDIGLLDAWLAQGQRGLFTCGDDLAADLAASAAGNVFLQGTLGLAYAQTDVRNLIGGQPAPVVVPDPDHQALNRRWVAYGGCPGLRDFDAVQPAAGAVRVSQFTAADGATTPYPYAAAVLKATGTSQVLALGHDLLAAANPPGPAPSMPAAAALLWDVSQLLYPAFSIPEHSPCASAAPDVAPARFTVTSRPNPFNATVLLRWSLERPSHLTMKVYDARGALVRTLVDGNVTETAGTVTWRGDDDSGRQAASGLYFVETRADGQVDVRKVTMLK